MLVPLLFCMAVLFVQVKRLMNPIQQILVIKGFFDEIHNAGPKSADGELDIAVAGDDDHRDMDSLLKPRIRESSSTT